MSYSYLALGDSYTIGENVLISESFPYQTVQLLRKKNLSFFGPEIIAKTGWTTDELQDEINKITFLEKYDFVSLLIGVNNQYRGRTIEEFTLQFKQLLQKAISLSGNNLQHVFVLSIPDWSVTLFAKERNIEKISEEIDAYNNACKIITIALGCNFLDITTQQKLDAANAIMNAADGLHPSKFEYAKWAESLADAIAAVCSA